LVAIDHGRHLGLGFAGPTSYGIPADDATVNALLLDTARYSEKFGAPLTAAELIEVETRLKLQRGLGKLDALLAAIPDKTAGNYIDHQRGGRLTVLLAGARDRRQERLIRDAVPMPERLEIRYVERSSREIESSRAAAADAVERIKADTGVAISSIRVDPPTNRVVIAVDALTPAKEALLRTRLGGSYAFEQKTDAKPEQDKRHALIVQGSSKEVL